LRATWSIDDAAPQRVEDGFWYRQKAPENDAIANFAVIGVG
jgi:hypothetical protein